MTTTLRQRMLHDLKIRGRADNTCRCYIDRISAFARHFGKSPEQLGPEEIRSFQIYLIEVKRASNSQLVQFAAAARFLYGVTLEKDWAVKKVPYPKKSKRLPVILSPREVKQLLDSTISLKHRAILMTLYGAGLRVSEACHLRTADIDSERMTIRVVQGKGSKDRYVLLPCCLLTSLREYWKAVRPRSSFLFPGRRNRAIRSRQVYRVCVDAAQAAGLTKHVTPHTLRHSFATHMLEQNGNVLHVQAMLGHTSLHTTSQYLHLTAEAMQASVSPLDALTNQLSEEASA